VQERRKTNPSLIHNPKNLTNLKACLQWLVVL